MNHDAESLSFVTEIASSSALLRPSPSCCGWQIFCSNPLAELQHDDWATVINANRWDGHHDVREHNRDNACWVWLEPAVVLSCPPALHTTRLGTALVVHFWEKMAKHSRPGHLALQVANRDWLEEGSKEATEWRRKRDSEFLKEWALLSRQANQLDVDSLHASTCLQGPLFNVESRWLLHRVCKGRSLLVEPRPNHGDTSSSCHGNELHFDPEIQASIPSQCSPKMDTNE